MKNEKLAIVDIDGTVAKLGDRLKYLKDKDYVSFYKACPEDTPYEKVIDTIEALAITHKIVFCTGRAEYVREETTKWLNEHMPVVCAAGYSLLMRPEGDHRHDTIVKPEKLGKWLEENGFTIKDITCVFEDRNSMADTWRELGLTCFQPLRNDF